MKKVLKIIGVIFLLLIIGGIILIIINNSKIKNSKKDTTKFIEEINELLEEKISYVVIEINPKAVLEMINDKITNIGCLNEDCETIFNVDINGKTLSEAVETLYETAKNKGINVSNGVNVSSTNNEIKKILENIEYVNYNEIDSEKEKILLDQVRDNENIKETKLNYNNKLLEFYKNDKDYDVLYACSMNNNELECHILEDFYNSIPAQPSLLNIYEYNIKHQKLMNVLDKFNIEYKTESSGVEGFDLFQIIEIDQVNLNNNLYDTGICYVNSDNTVPCINDIVIDKILESGDYGYLYKVIPFTKLNLVNKTYNESELLEYRNYQSMIITGPGVEVN